MNSQGNIEKDDEHASLEGKVAAAGSSSLHTLETMREPAVLVDSTGHICGTTAAFSVLAEMSPKDLRGMEINRLLPQLLGSAGIDIARELVDEDREWSYATPLPVALSDAPQRWVTAHVSNIYDESGRSAGRLLTLRDVSLLHHARVAIEEGERKYEQLVESVNSAILRLGTDLAIRYANDYTLHFFGYTMAELIGRNLLDTLVPERDPNGNDLHAFVRNIMAQPELNSTYDQFNRCSDGRGVWIHWSVRALRDPLGNVNELLCVGTDITQRKRAELLAEHYLKRSRRLAQELASSEERERSNMATYLHDQILQMLSLANIRLGGVLSEVRTAGESDTEKRIESVRSLLDDAEARCRSMMDQLVPSLLYEFGLCAAIGHLVEKDEMNGVDIEVDDRLGDTALPDEVAGVLFRGVRELLMNTLKYADAERIRISVWRKDDDVYASVEDDGKGFDPALIERNHYDETGGFGLFAVRERLEGLRGVLEVESAAGKGTLAVMRVPLASGI